jgi:hypothetical protein
VRLSSKAESCGATKCTTGCGEKLTPGKVHTLSTCVM